MSKQVEIAARLIRGNYPDMGAARANEIALASVTLGLGCHQAVAVFTHNRAECACHWCADARGARVAKWSEKECLDFGRASADTAIDQREAYSSLQESADSHRQNVIDTLAEYNAIGFKMEALEAFDARLAELTAPVAAYEDLPVWQVTILCPLEARQRKHSILFYNVVRRTEKEAIEAVRTAVIAERPYKGYRIIDCSRAGSSLSVRLHGTTNRLPSQVENAPTL